MSHLKKNQTLGKVYFFGQELEFCFYKMALVNRICQRSLMALPFRKFLQGTTRLPLVSQQFCRFKKTTSVEFPETKTTTRGKQCTVFERCEIKEFGFLNFIGWEETFGHFWLTWVDFFDNHYWKSEVSI